MYSVLQSQQKVFQLFKLGLNLFLKTNKRKISCKLVIIPLFSSLETPAFFLKQVNPSESYNFAL